MILKTCLAGLLAVGAGALGNRTTAPPPPPTVVDTAGNITYVGLCTVNGTVEKFLNIPYGADTSGARRFADPLPAAVPPAGTVVNASAQGPVCPQVASGGFQYQTNSTWFSEDCLRLKVARPAGVTAGDDLPVMVCKFWGLVGYTRERRSPGRV